MREQILYYALCYEGDYRKITKAMQNEEPWEKIGFEGNYVTIEDEDYPEKLRRLEYAPWILFYEGDLSLCKLSCCSVVGSRLLNAQGIKDCITICKLLKKNYVIVAGLAKGVDACAHEEALTHHTIGVIGCGLDITYPSENAMLYEDMRRTQLILSEYPPGSKPFAYHFPWRNRIIAALSDAVVVIQAKEHSGTMLTVNEAISLDIPVYCVPHHFGDKQGEGCNLLISQGANILVDERDVKEI